MNGWLPEIEGWVKIAGVLVGVVMAVLVPVRSWIVEDRRYRAQMMEAAAAAGRTVSAAVTAPPLAPAVLYNTVQMEGLIAALRDCSAAIREATRHDQETSHERLVRALDRLVERP